jgi:hypothetical protein
MQVDSTREGRAHDLVGWRREQLAVNGFPSRLATLVARDRRFDLHALIELVERGCPPELAVRIVAPLDGDGGVS